MSGKKKITIGTIVILVGIAQMIAVSLFTSNRPELRILSPISSGIVGGWKRLYNKFQNRINNAIYCILSFEMHNI